ncbi:MAG TPA: transporter substrate-binding domain-containing protein [Microvirga sp.]|jgi:polar amino acid transport system substrate-binding protein|nr:transporter substrate-binding domain-containing protein [Microvirga sp.]
MWNIVSLWTFLQREIKASARAVAALCLALIGSLSLGEVRAQDVSIPNFWGSRAQLERPDLGDMRTIRFLADDDFPPLHFAGLDGAPTGFSVELARAACERLAVTCTVQVRRFDTLLDALADRQGDVVAAAIPVNADLRRRFEVTSPYFKIPARFAVKTSPDKSAAAPDAKTLQGKTVGVVGGTAHEAYARAFMSMASLKPYPDMAAAQTALKAGEIEYLFADGLGLALWIGGEEAGGCCGFAGGPYLESRFFGEGIGFVTRKQDESLRRALDFALQQLWKEGKYAELYLRFFPVSPF